MSQYNSVLKMYAESGLRTMEDWSNHGRDITAGETSRVDGAYRGAALPLFTRAQTQLKVKAEKPARPVTPVPASMPA